MHSDIKRVITWQKTSVFKNNIASENQEADRLASSNIICHLSNRCGKAHIPIDQALLLDRLDQHEDFPSYENFRRMTFGKGLISLA